LFLSAASLVELKAAIERVRGRDTKRAEALQAWLDGLVTTFSDRIHPIDIQAAVRAGRLLPYRQEGLIRDRFHDVILAATAQIHGHGLLTKRVTVFGAWTHVKVASP
jgi:predicted nucleic acid-binding protein